MFTRSLYFKGGFLLVMTNIKKIILHFLKGHKEVVIGEPIARAMMNEEQRIVENKVIISPMPQINYSNWPDEKHLLNPTINSLDTALFDLCKTYEQCNIEQRLEFRRSISMDEIYTLLTFSKRVAVFGIRSQDKSLVKSGLVAIAMIECDRCDYRDILWALSLLYHSALRVSDSPEQIFFEAAELSEGKVSELITGFLKRDKKEKDLRSSWGYEEVQIDSGIGFINWGFKHYNPSKNITKLAIEISDYIRSDIYELGEVTAGTEIPAIWLLSNEDTEVSKVLNSAKGFVSISSRQRKSEFERQDSQLILIFVGQMQTESDAKFLLKRTQEISSESYCKIGIAIRDLFCILITRSYIVGVKPNETNETIKRFEKPIENLINKYA